MPWPGLNDLQEALQHPARAFTDRALRDSTIALNQLGLPLSWSGNFAAVFQIISDGHPYAIRCFTHNPLGKQHHYEAIDRHLKTNGRPSTFIDFDYQEEGLICRGQNYPLIKMPWIHGQTLDDFAYANISSPDVLEQLVAKWYQAATELQQLPIAHNDLQHGNIMVERDRRAAIKLVDYDGLYVPQFARQRSPENGHRHYQHPQRDQRHYGPQVDNFPALVIYTSLTALAHDPGARARRATPESLLFSQDDLQDPPNSKLFQYLKQSQHRLTGQLAHILSEAAIAPVNDSPTLEEAHPHPAKRNLPSWLNQSTQPRTPAWTRAGTPNTTAPAHIFVPPATSSPDPAQHNRDLIDQKLQQIARKLKTTVISYAQHAEQSGWIFQPITNTTGDQVKTIQELHEANPDPVALTAVLLAITNHRGDAPLSSIGISTAQLRKIHDIGDEHAQSRVDFSDQNYVNDAINNLTRFTNALNQLPAIATPDNLTTPQPGPWANTQTFIRTIARRHYVGIIAATLGLIAIRTFPRFDNISTQEDILLAIIAIAVIALIIDYVSKIPTARRIIKRLPAVFARFCASAWATPNRGLRYTKTALTIGIPLTAAFLLVAFLSTPPQTQTTPEQIPPTTVTPPTPTPVNAGVPPPTITLIPMLIDPARGLTALGTHYAGCNGLYPPEQRATRINFINRAMTVITPEDLQKFVEAECPITPKFTGFPQAKPNTPVPKHRSIPPTKTPVPTPTIVPTLTPIPTATPTPPPTPIPTPTPNPYQSSTSLKPADVQRLFHQHYLVNQQDYEIIGCYHDPNPSAHTRKWLLFTTPDQVINWNTFTVHYQNPVQLQHGACYQLTLQHLGPTEWRACTTQPYGANCTNNSPDFLWARDIPAFRGTAADTTYLWRPNE